MGTLLTIVFRSDLNSVMVDVWWGIVEAAGPQQYNWTGYDPFLASLTFFSDIKLWPN
jgi:hypothetical protein